MKGLCGIDIVKISRIEDSIEKLGEDFLNRIYTEDEIKYCETKKITKYQSYAARFAAKEAMYKALKLNDDSIIWQEIEIKKDNQGAPYIKLHGRFQEIAKERKICNIDVSLSHDAEYAIASVILNQE